MQGILLTDTSEKMNSMNLLLYMAPIASLVLIPAVLLGEPDVLAVVHQHAITDKCAVFLSSSTEAMPSSTVAPVL